MLAPYALYRNRPSVAEPEYEFRGRGAATSERRTGGSRNTSIKGEREEKGEGRKEKIGNAS